MCVFGAMHRLIFPLSFERIVFVYYLKNRGRKNTKPGHKRSIVFSMGQHQKQQPQATMKSTLFNLGTFFIL